MPFIDMLEGGHPNSLGRTHEVVDIVLENPGRLEELFTTIADPDQVVRLRVGDALKTICRERPNWFVPHVDRILGVPGRSISRRSNGTWPRCCSTFAATCRTIK